MIRSILLWMGLLIGAAAAQTATVIPQTGVNQVGQPATSRSDLSNAMSTKADWPLKVSTGLPYVANNAALAALGAGQYTTVYRQSFALLGDGGAAIYNWSTSPCSLNSGTGDGGSQIPPNTGTGCWLAVFNDTTVINARIWGAKGDGVTNDSRAIQAAINTASSLGGRTVVLPATGHAYLLNTGLTIGNGSGITNVSIEGTGGMYWSGYYDNTEADWTSHGTWIHCTDIVNACISMNGNGGKISGLSFWYTQPTPPGPACGLTCTFTHNWAPVAYPYTLAVLAPQNFNSISDINVINGYNCMDIEGPSTGVASFFMHVDHVHLGCFNIVSKFVNIDNTISLHDFRDQILWYQFSSDVVGYTEGDSAHVGHKIGMDMAYVSGIELSDVEFYQDWTGIRASDASVQSGLGTVTFGVQALQANNMSFNQTCQAITLAASTTHFSGRFSNVILNVDPQTSYIAGQCGSAWPYAFNLASDNVDVSISNLDGYVTQTLAKIGGGTSGTLHLPGSTRASYSAFSTGAPGILVANGAALDMPSDVNALFPVTGAAGPPISGATNWPNVVNTTQWIHGPSGTARQQLFLTTPTNGSGDQTRWGVRVDNTAEGGSANAGSGFLVDRYADNGSYIDSPLSINRSTGIPQFPNSLQMSAPLVCTGLPTGEIFNNNGVAGFCGANAASPFFVNGLQMTAPTSCSGQPTGEIWNNAGVASFCP